MSILRLAPALAALLVLACGPADAKPSAKPSDCRATQASYAALKRGMSYHRAAARLGCPGRRVTHMTIGRTERTTYTWRGTGSYGANLTVSFRDGRLTSKSQLGLN